MQQWMLKLSGLSLLLVGALFITSCEEDGGGTDPGNPLDPFIQLLSGNDVISGDAMVDAGVPFNVRIDAQTGDNELESISLFQDGSLISTSRMEFDLGLTTTQNPFLLVGADRNGKELLAAIDLHDSGTATYRFTVTDAAGNTDEVSIDVSVGQPIDEEFSMVVVNNASGPSQGGVDLGETPPATVSSGSNNADFVDAGIDTDLPTDANWLKQLIPSNGASISLFLDSEDRPNFDEVSSKEAIVDLYNDSDGTLYNDGELTAELVVGDIFVVRDGSNYFLVRVDRVEETPIPNDNNDFYEFTVKQALDAE